MHFFILQFLMSFACLMTFMQLLTGVQILFFIRQTLLGHRDANFIALSGFLITGILASVVLAFIPKFYLNFIQPYSAIFNLILIVFCFFYAFICLTNRFTHPKNNAVILFIIGVLLAILCFVFCTSFLVMFAISLGRIGVTSYIFENFALSIGAVFIILSFIYYYLIMILNLNTIKKQFYKIHSFIDPLFVLSFAGLGFWLLP